MNGCVEPRDSEAGDAADGDEAELEAGVANGERARNELATTQAEAAKKIAEAEGDAQSAINRAKGEAESNRIRLASLTPQMLELRKLENQKALIEKWNGQLPTVESSGNGSGLLLQLPKQ